MSRTVQLHISQDEIEKYMMSKNKLRCGITVDVTVEEDDILLDVWSVDTSTKEEVNIKSNRLNVGQNNKQAMFMWCIFLGTLVYLNNVLLHSQVWY